MGDQKPTDSARSSFGRVKMHSKLAHVESAKSAGNDAMYRSHMAISMHELGEGLEALTTGLRATYILLEDVKRQLEFRR